MQSPIGVFLRVVAMMGCLVAVPLTAMFGTSSVSRVAALVFDGPWSAKSASARESEPERGRGGAVPSCPLAAEVLPVAFSVPARAPVSEEPKDSPFSAMQRRLEDLGAMDYRLQSWGADGCVYRFHCRMAVAEDPDWNRHFEATAGDPLEAITQVVEEIEAWRGIRSLSLSDRP